MSERSTAGTALREPDAVPPVVTVIVPTYNERDNVVPLLERLADAVGALPVEVLFVDDSTDDTPDVVLAAARTARLPVRLLHREGAQRVGGLGGAVLAGLRSTQAEWAVVMDGDLQHPPEVLPDMLRTAAHERADVVVASRYVRGGSATGLANGWRRRVSTGAAGVARALFPRRLRQCSDPMSGYFLVRREAVDLDRLRPDGFKILLEILARGSGLRVGEVPFSFATRHAGDSKADLRQGLVYARHLLRLRTDGVLARLAAFLLIGATGVLPNLATMAALLMAGVHYAPAVAISTVVAATWNFVLTDSLLFRSRRSRPTHERWLAYLGLSVVDIVLRVPVVAVLVEGAQVAVLPATVASIVLAGVLRFLAVDRWLYRHSAAVEVEAATSPEAGSGAQEWPDPASGTVRAGATPERGSRGHAVLLEVVQRAA